MAYNRKQRLNDNIKAIETTFILDREQRTPTARERLLLERYCGFGGLKCILNPARELADAVHWAKSDLELFAPTVELHRLIRENSKNESEYKQLMDSLKQSVLTAFYTPSAVTEALTDVLKEHQIIPEKVLEPSAGIGAFVDSVLDNNPKADIMAFEKDLLTGKILHHLHPEQKVRIEGFEKIEKPFNDYFDLAISNIPFGDVTVFDPSYTAMKGMRALVTRRIHNYFFVKALDMVRDGGLVAFITSQGVLNAKNNSAARFMMLYHADLVSAIRLPNNLFTENANTEVGSDLIILQKNTQKESLRGDDNLLDTVYNDENRIPTNNYFLEHPERIIHTTAKLDTDPFGKPAMIYTHENGVEGIAEDLRKMLHEDFKKNLNLNRYLGIEETKAEEVKEVEETEKIEKTEKIKPSIEEKQNDTVVSLQKQEKPTDDAELSQKSNHQQPPVQMTLFDLWGMEEENRLTVHATKKKAEVTVGAAAKKGSRKRASPLVKSVNPTFEVVTKPVEKEEKPSLTDAKEQETTQETKPILPGDEPYASISWEENPPINGFYEMMMTMAPEDRVLLRQKAELHRQEQLKALGVEDTLDPKFKPPMEPIEVLKVQIGHGQSKGNEAKEDSKTQSTLKETNHEREQQKEQERKREELAKKKEDAMKPRPFDEKLESFHREGSMVLDSARNIGVLKDLTKYGATFMPLDLNMEQKEKAVLYIALRDAYQKLYTYEAEEQTENKQMRESLNVYYDAFFIRFGNLNAKQNVKFILMDASGRDMLSLERVENGQFTKSDIFDHPVSFSLDEVSHVDSPEEALTASLNKFGRIDLPYMTELSDMPEPELTEALKGRIRIIAKIENQEGINNLTEILAAADGIMVARGDMGVEIDFTEIPAIQKNMIAQCVAAGKPVITATQMLDSMIENPRPTRAEITDVANAIYDGTSAIMLSGETAAGRYPVEAVRTMDAIARKTESHIDDAKLLGLRCRNRMNITAATAHAACTTAKDIGADAILTVSQAGITAQMVSSFRPETTVVALLLEEQVQRQMALYWGVEPITMPRAENTDELVELAVQSAEKAGLIRHGDLVVITAGVPVGISGTTNMIRIQQVGGSLLNAVGIGSRTASGPLCVCRSVEEVAEKFHAGDVLVVPYTTNELLPYLRDAAAIICEEGSAECHAATVGLLLSKPVLVGAGDATRRLEDGVRVSVDCARGVVQTMPQ